MTGIERLRRLAGSQDMDNAWTAMLANELTDIADQIERENTEDAEDAAWVREHGGLAEVEKEWNARSNLKRSLETAQAKVERQQRHIELVQGKCKARVHRIVELNKQIADMRQRLVPEGMCWPVFEDGEPVRIGDVVSDVEVRSVVFRDGGILLSDCTSVPGWGTWRSYKEPIKRPAPEVLDADGVEIRVGDTVYLLPGDWCDKFPLLSCHEWDAMKVLDLSPNHDTGRIECETSPVSVVCYPYPSQLTHRAPVLAADGKPLREGEHVYHVETGAELVVKGLPKPGEYQAVVVLAPPVGHLTSFDPDQLTHQRPVLDADGVEIRVGDKLYDTETGCARIVRAINAIGTVEFEGCEDRGWFTKFLTHQRPVLDADGVPIHKGDTVYFTDGRRQECNTVVTAKYDYKDEPYVQLGRLNDVGYPTYTNCSCIDPSQLTHQRPDSWERLEEDVASASCPDVYCANHHIDASDASYEWAMARDIVRRAKALAERERGE